MNKSISFRHLKLISNNSIEQMEIWDEYLEGKISWNKTKEGILRLARVHPDHREDYYSEWLDSQRHNFSKGSNSVLESLSDFDNLFYQFENGWMLSDKKFNKIYNYHINNVKQYN